MTYLNSPWDEESNVTYLTTEWAAGKSATQIGKAMTRNLKREITRGAVIGRLSRMGLIGHREKTHPKVLGGMSKPTRDARRMGRRAPPPPPAPMNQAFTPRVDTPITVGMPFVERGARCVWPLGEPGMMMLCCALPLEPGRPYCPEHCKIAYVPAKEKRDRERRDRVRPEPGRYAEPVALDRMAA